MSELIPYFQQMIVGILGAAAPAHIGAAYVDFARVLTSASRTRAVRRAANDNFASGQ